MKHINKLTKAAGALSILLLVFSFAGCGNALEENTVSAVPESVETTVEGITLKGEIKLSGAAPSRAATSSFNCTYTWRILASYADMSYENEGHSHADMQNSYRTKVETKNTFSLVLPKEGKWNIYISGYAGYYTEDTLPPGAQPLFTCEDQLLEITAAETNKKVTFQAKLNPYAFINYGSEVDSSNGSINLPVTVSASSVYQVSATLTKYQGTEDDTPINVTPQRISGGKASLIASNIPVGVYIAKIYFEDEPGNILYACQEAITVYPGLTTDTWFGTAPYFQNGEFVLSSTVIANYKAEIVITTPMALYNLQSGSSYSLSYGETELYTNNSANCFDFDKNGNLYALVVNEGEYYLQSNRNTFTTSDTGQSVGCTGHITIDREKDILWMFMEQEHSIYRYNNISTRTDLSARDAAYVSGNSFYRSKDSEYTYSPNIFKAYNGCLYFAKYQINSYPDSNVLYITSTDVTSDAHDDGFGNIIVKGKNTTQINPSDIGLSEASDNAEITDMLCQDGAVYVIVRDYKPGTYGVDAYSRGLLIKYDIFTNSCTTLIGFAPKKSLTTFKAACSYKNGDTVSKVFNTYPSDYDSKDLYIAEFTCSSDPSEINFYTPFGSNLASYFAGPQRFVAVKPKKLIISDTGIAFYTNDDGVVSYKNVNRIVEVDLKTLSISESTDFDGKFDSDTTFSEGNNTISALPSKGGLDLTNTYYCYSPGGYTTITEANPVVVPYFAEGL